MANMNWRMTRELLSGLLFLSFSASSVIGQVLHESGELPSFAVATVKAANPGERIVVNRLGQTDTVRTAGTVRSLIGQAYGLDDGTDLVIGGDKWIDQQVYDVEGKIPEAIYLQMQEDSPEKRQREADLMMQSLLALRFGLKVHFETHQLPVYELTPAKSGLKLKANADDDPGNGTANIVFNKSWMRLRVSNMTLDNFAGYLQSTVLDHPVINRTGIAGRYTFDLSFAPEGKLASVMQRYAGSSESTAPSLSTVIQDLGLNVRPAIGPVETVVLDQVTLPSPN